MPVALNKVLYDTSISLNRVFVLEFVKCLCIGAPPKDPAQRMFVVFWDFRETREFPSQTTTSGSQLGGGEINIRDQSSTPPLISMERPLDDAAMLHIIRDCMSRSDPPLHHESSSSLEKFIAQHIARRESEWFPCKSRDLHSLAQKLADTQAKVINRNSASMRCRQQQQMLLRQLINGLTFCSPRRRMQRKLQ